MKAFKELWSYVTLPPDEQPATLAILVARPSDAMSHYIERLVANLRILCVRPLKVVIFEQVQKRTQQDELLASIAQAKPDFFIAMDSEASGVLVRFAQEENITKLGFLLGYKDLVPHTFSHSLNGIFPPDNLWEHNYKLIHRIYPKLTTMLLCGGHAMLDRHKPLQEMRRKAAAEGVTIHSIYVDGADSLARQFAQYGDIAEVAFFVFDPSLFPHARQLVQLSREYSVFSIASNLFAIHEGVDIAIGYPEAAVFERIAHDVISALQIEKKQQPADLFFDFELHCNVQGLKESPYILQNIGKLFLEEESVSVHVHADEQARR